MQRELFVLFTALVLLSLMIAPIGMVNAHRDQCRRPRFSPHNST